MDSDLFSYRCNIETVTIFISDLIHRFSFFLYAKTAYLALVCIK